MKHQTIFHFVLITIVLVTIVRVENAFGDPKSDIYLFWYNEAYEFKNPPSSNMVSGYIKDSQALTFSEPDRTQSFSINQDRKNKYACLAFELKTNNQFIPSPLYQNTKDSTNPFEKVYDKQTYYLFYFKKPFLNNLPSFTFEYSYRINDKDETNQLIFNRQKDSDTWKVSFISGANRTNEIANKVESGKTAKHIETIINDIKNIQSDIETIINDIKNIQSDIENWWIKYSIIPITITAISMILLIILSVLLFYRIGHTKDILEKFVKSYDTLQPYLNSSIVKIQHTLNSINNPLEEIKANILILSSILTKLDNIDSSLLTLQTKLQNFIDEPNKFQSSILEALSNINKNIEDLATTIRSQKDQKTTDKYQTSVLLEDPSIKIKNKWDNILDNYKKRVEPILSKHKEIQESLKKASNAQYANELNAIDSYVKKSRNSFQEIAQYQYPLIDPLVEDLEEAYKRLFLANVQSELVNKALDAFFELYTYCQRTELENLQKTYPDILSIIASELFQVIQEFLAKQKTKMIDIKLYETTFEPSYHKPVDSQMDSNYDNNVILKVFKAGLTNLEGNQVKRLAEVVVNKLKD